MCDDFVMVNRHVLIAMATRGDIVHFRDPDSGDDFEGRHQCAIGRTSSSLVLWFVTFILAISNRTFPADLRLTFRVVVPCQLFWVFIFC